MRNKSKLRDQNEKASAIKFATRRKKGFGGEVRWGLVGETREVGE